MDFSALRLEIADGIARLTLADPARGNPVDGDMCRDLRVATDSLIGRSDVRAVLLAADGPVFSYGGDISTFTENLEALPKVIAGWAADLNRAVVNLQNLDAPLIAAVQGICAGGMVGLAAGADIVVVADDARFVAAYAGIGFCCDGGSSITVTRRIGPAKARRFFLMNETLDAATALALGLADEITEERPLAQAEKIAVRLAKGPTKAFGEMRRLLATAQSLPLHTQLDLEAEALVRCAGRAEATEGILAFSQRRKPDFAGTI